MSLSVLQKELKVNIYVQINLKDNLDKLKWIYIHVLQTRLDLKHTKVKIPLNKGHLYRWFFKFPLTKHNYLDILIILLFGCSFQGPQYFISVARKKRMLPPLSLAPLRGNVVRTFVEICAETVAALARNQQARAALTLAMFGQKKKSRRA